MINSLLCPPLFFQLCVPAIIMNICRTAMVNSNLKYLLGLTTYPNFVSLAQLQVQFNNLAAVIVFLAWIKVRLKFYIFYLNM